MPPVLTPSRIVVAVVLAAAVVMAGVLVFESDSTPPRTGAVERTPSGGVVWEPPVKVASGAAYRGPWRMNESDWQFVDDPSVALSDDGSIGVIWTDHVEQDLFFQVYDSSGTATLPAPTNVSRNPDTFSWLPRIVLPSPGADTVYALWQEIIFSGGTHGGDVLFARSVDGGQSFSEPINLSKSEAGDGKGRLTREYWHNGSLDLAVGPNGTIYAAWTEYEGRLWLSRSTDRGAHFSEPVHVAGTNDRPARGPSLAIHSSERVHLVWAVGGAPSTDIQYTRSTVNWRTFAPPTGVITTDGHSDAPSLAVDPSGTLHLAYGESPSGPFQQYHIRYTRRPPDADAFGDVRRISTAPSDRIESAHFPTLRAPSNDTLHVLWERYPDGGRRSRGLTYASSVDGGRSFCAPILVPGSADAAPGFNGSQQGLLMEKLAVNGTGDVAVVNSTFDRGDSSYIWLHQGTMLDE